MTSEKVKVESLRTTELGNPFSSVDYEVPDAVKPLVESIVKDEADKVKEVISDITRKNKANDLRSVYVEQETILHHAVKLRASKEIVKALLTACPNLITESRNNSDLYRGQTALHIAITGEDVEVTEEILKQAKDFGVVDEILSSCATGSRFENTVMLGEIPLLVAALTLNVKLFDKILEYGAKMDSQNSKGDNVCHCLIQYADLYPEKLADVMTMLEHISGPQNISKGQKTVTNKVCPNEPRNKSSYIWLMKNNEGLNPLKCAAKLGQDQIFKFIMEMKDVYCYVNSEDGLFDVELYDVTDIDSTSEFKLIDIIRWFDTAVSVKNEPQTQKENSNSAPCKVPTLEMIFGNDSKTVFKFIEMSPLRYVINRKWQFYRWLFALWGFLHILFIIGYTVYAVRRSSVDKADASSTRDVYSIGEDAYVTFCAILSLVFAFLYISQEIIRIIKGRMPWTFSHIMNCYHNGPFRLVLVLFGLTVVGDFLWKIMDAKYGDYFLVCSMILGWWFLVFFLRGFKQFSFFTVMIQKVLVGDMFRFSIIIGMELIAFTTGIYIVFRGTPTFGSDIPENENVHEYSKLTVAMFKMMFGFTSLDVLFTASHPWFAVCLYVAFVLLTYVLMINSLIAMMSNTCSLVSQNRDIQYRVQQLSIILFFESILPVCALRMVGQPRVCDWFDTNTQQVTKRTRLFMEVRSLHEVTKRRSVPRPNTETMLETIFHTVRNIQLPTISMFTEEEAVAEESKHKPIQVRRTNLENVPRDDRDEDNVSDSQERKPKRKHKKKKRSTNREETKIESENIHTVNSIGEENDIDFVNTSKETNVRHSNIDDLDRLTSVEQI